MYKPQTGQNSICMNNTLHEFLFLCNFVHGGKCIIVHPGWGFSRGKIRSAMSQFQPHKWKYCWKWGGNTENNLAYDFSQIVQCKEKKLYRTRINKHTFSHRQIQSGSSMRRRCIVMSASMSCMLVTIWICSCAFTDHRQHGLWKQGKCSLDVWGLLQYYVKGPDQHGLKYNIGFFITSFQS